MFLETERLILRKFEESDLSDFCELVMDDELNRMMGNWPVDSEEKARELLDWFLHGEKWAYAIVLRETGKLIGDLTIYEEPPEEVRNAPETAQRGRTISTTDILTLTSPPRRSTKSWALRPCARAASRRRTAGS